MTIPSIKFKKPLQKTDGQSSSVLMVISIDQLHQQKEEFEAFCYGINSEYEKHHCYQLTIIETGYLKRHYLRLDPQYSSEEEADLAAIKLGREWVDQHRSSLDNLQIPHKIYSWQEIVERQASQGDRPFSEYLEKVEQDYKKDKAFRNFVDGLTNKYSIKLAERFNFICNPDKDSNIQEKLDKQYKKAAYNYLIEESTIIFKLIHYGFTDQVYPGNANAAVKYIYRKYFGKYNPLPWTEYAIKYPVGNSLPGGSNGFFQSNKSNNFDIKAEIKALYEKLSSDDRIFLVQELENINLNSKQLGGNS